MEAMFLLCIWLSVSLHAVTSFQPLRTLGHEQSVFGRTGCDNHRQQQHYSLKSTGVAHRHAWIFTGDSSSSRQVTSLYATRKQHRDVVIVGGGLAGMSVALYLTQLDPERHVTILDREESKPSKTSAGSFAAAGMLAPQSERLPKGHLLDICMASKRMYPDFADLVETMARESGEEGAQYLWSSSSSDSPNDQQDKQNGLEPWNIGYVASGGFLAPAFAGDTVESWSPPDDIGTATWLDQTQVRELEPNLHPKVVGGWWFPEDSSVDARRLICSLRAACVGAGVQILNGKNYEVSSLDLENGTCRGLWLKNGKYFTAKTIVVANGSWMRTLLPVPIEPHKGQSLSLRMPKDRPPILRRVLFGQDSYIVPKADGRIVIGATVEAGSFDPNVTPAGLLHILSYATQLLPGLADLPIEETWAGLRPTTPDKGPIIGETPWKNLLLAGGYWRNGVLLAPKTGQLLASLIAGIELSDSDKALLNAFTWDRFTNKGGGTELAVNSRYIASMYPVHTRKSGAGIAAAVGTELGSYSTARSATEERKQERDSLFDEDEEVFKRAAAMGKEDAKAFDFGDYFTNKMTDKGSTEEDDDDEEEEDDNDDDDDFIEQNPALEPSSSTVPLPEGAPDAFTVGIATSKQYDYDEKQTGEIDDDEENDLSSIYKKIQSNKAEAKVEMNQDQDAEKDDRPDPGFRIYHVHPVTNETRVVPPYTTPSEFLKSINLEEQPGLNFGEAEEEMDDLDGYQSIIKKAEIDANIKETMREARKKNREGLSGIIDWVEDNFADQKTKRLQDLQKQKAAEEEAAAAAAVRPINRNKINQNWSNGYKKDSDDSQSVFDGYQDVENSALGMSKQEQLEAMRAARRSNREGMLDIDESKIPKTDKK